MLIAGRDAGGGGADARRGEEACWRERYVRGERWTRKVSDGDVRYGSGSAWARRRKMSRGVSERNNELEGRQWAA